MTPSTFGAFLAKPSTSVLLDRMLADNRRVDAQLVAEQVAQSDERVEATSGRAQGSDSRRELAQCVGDCAFEGVR